MNFKKINKTIAKGAHIHDVTMKKYDITNKRDIVAIIIAQNSFIIFIFLLLLY